MSSTKPLHTWDSWIAFGDTDPARRIYFARIFEFGHRCLEDYTLKNKLYDQWFNKPEWGTPVRHAEAEYFKPLRPGDPITVKMFAHRLGQTSFTWRYEICKDDELMALVRITHVTVNVQTGATGPVVESVKKLFQSSGVAV